MFPELCICLVGVINDPLLLYKQLAYYKKFTDNLILITYNFNFNINLILKYVKKENLIIIPSNLNGQGLKAPKKDSINNFYYDSSDLIISNNTCKRIFISLSLLYKFMKENPNKYKYILRTRIDMLFSLSDEIISEFIEKSNANKIIRLPLSIPMGILSHEDKILFMETRDNNNFVETRHCLNLNKPYIPTFHITDYLDFSKYDLFYNFLDLNFVNINFNPKIWSNIETHYAGVYIYLKEKENTGEFPSNLNREVCEKLIYKYFDYISANNLVMKHNDTNNPLDLVNKFKESGYYRHCRLCVYWDKDFKKNSKTKYLKNSVLPCMYCLKENILNE